MDEKKSRKIKIAQDILTLSRNNLLVNLRYLDMALSMLEPVPFDEGTILTDGKHLVFNPSHILKSFRQAKENVVRDYLHMILHCVFRHMFVGPDIDIPLWNLACDIAVENTIGEIGLTATNAPRAALQKQTIGSLTEKLQTITAERLYSHFKESHISGEEISRLNALFLADDHEIWYMSEEAAGGKFGFGTAPREDPTENGNGSGGSDTSDTKAGLSSEWQRISERMQVDAQTFAKQRGDVPGSLTQNLREVNREKYDYTAFLRKFAVLGEAMKINDDEFDYVFYTYGLNLYGNMPLVEPLEYKDVKRIREFVIAIDTSGSTSGELVQRFINKTYNILESTESFFSKINMHIIQCDAEISEHVKITSKKEFDAYLKNMTLKGGGGTDFKPVFAEVERLIKAKEFTNLKGLIYFTDGCGEFPKKKPKYETAFVFVDDEFNNYDVPEWAIKLVLKKEEL